MTFLYARTHPNGYECSSQGDKRFSAFYARLPGGVSIENAYQLDVKGYRKYGNDFRLGKGRPPLDPKTDTWAEYKKLWCIWAANHPAEMEQLRKIVSQFHGGMLTDRYANTPISQARALAEILNEYPNLHDAECLSKLAEAGGKAP